MASAFSFSLASTGATARSRRAASCAYGQGRPCVAGQSCARRCDRNARCAGRTSTHQHANVPATAAALLPSSSPCLKYKDGVGNYKALYERVTKRVAINRERAHPALHQNRACCCPLHICSLLLVAAHCWPSDDLSDGLFDRPSDRPSDPASDVLSLMASLMASLMTSLMLSPYSSAGLVSRTSQYVKRERERARLKGARNRDKTRWWTVIDRSTTPRVAQP